MNRLVYIYQLKNPITDNIRYVGKTVQSLDSRLKKHIEESNQGLKTYKCNWIRKLLKENIIPDIETIEITDENMWKEREKYWIANYKKRGYNLTNSTNGGEDGWSQRKNKIPWNKGLTKETSKRLKEVSRKNSKNMKGNIPWNKGLTAKIDERVAKHVKPMNKYISSIKGKLIEEIYGVEKADKIRAKFISKIPHNKGKSKYDVKLVGNKWQRKCLNCLKTLEYFRQIDCLHAAKRKSWCKSCAAKNRGK